MNESRFVDPTGLSPANVSTASDLAKMVRAAHDYPLIREYSTKSRATVQALRARPLQLRQHQRPGALEHWEIGLSKTGYISEAGRCLVMQVRLASKDLIVVLLDSWGKQSADRRRQPPQQVARERRRRPAARASGFPRGRRRGAFAPAEVASSQVFLRCRGQPPVRAHLPPSRVLPDARRARAHAPPSGGHRALRRPRLPADRVRQRRGHEEPAADPRAAPGGLRADRHFARTRCAPRRAALAREFPWLRIAPVAGDFSRPLDIPVRRGTPTRGLLPRLDHRQPDARGSARLPLACRAAWRATHAGRRRPEEGPGVLHAAYNDTRGVTAAFNLNLLARINRELGADFDLRRFRHYAFYNPARGPHRDAPGGAASAHGAARRPPLPLRRGRDHPHREFLQVLARGVRARSPREGGLPRHEGLDRPRAGCSPCSVLPRSAAGAQVFFRHHRLDHAIAWRDGRGRCRGLRGLGRSRGFHRRGRTRTGGGRTRAQVFLAHHWLDHALDGRLNGRRRYERGRRRRSARGSHLRAGRLSRRRAVPQVVLGHHRLDHAFAARLRSIRLAAVQRAAVQWEWPRRALLRPARREAWTLPRASPPAQASASARPPQGQRRAPPRSQAVRVAAAAARSAARARRSARASAPAWISATGVPASCSTNATFLSAMRILHQQAHVAGLDQHDRVGRIHAERGVARTASAIDRLRERSGLPATPAIRAS